MKRNNWIGASLAMLVVGTLCQSAFASDTFFTASACTPNKASNSLIDRVATFGVTNSSTTLPATVECPISLPFLATNVSTVRTTVYDRSTTANVACTLYLTDSAGNLFWSQAQSSSGASAAAQDLVWAPATGTWLATMECSIPAVAGLGNSHVVSYRVISTP